MTFRKAETCQVCDSNVMVERQCIGCLTSSKQLVMLEIATKRHMADIVRAKADYFTLLGNFLRMEEG